MKDDMRIGKGILWVLLWFGFMLLYTALDVTVWRKIDPLYGKYLNLFSIIFCMVVFLLLLTKKNNFRIDLLGNISFQGILLALVCEMRFVKGSFCQKLFIVKISCNFENQSFVSS